jgi:L-ascorbate metabolism protein UlaG (beta-lactamase superfamily)
MIYLISLLAILLSVPVIGILLSAPRYKGPVSDHFDGRRFFNPGNAKAKGLKEVLQWMANRKRSAWADDLNAGYGVRPLEFVRDGIRITFVNHSTFLIQVSGLNILTDPVWSKRVSPFSNLGPKRKRSPGIRLEDLPRIHFVLLSHNHYDHLDLLTMRIISGAHHPKIITPLGVQKFLDELQINGSTDMDWWDEMSLSDSVRIQSVPAQHFSGRGMLDRDATLWCGYVLKTSFGNLYFAGDTGYNPTTFKEIGRRCSPIKISIIPVGAYKPAWFMSPIHTSPAEAVKIHVDTKSSISIGSHFGTFPLADDGIDEVFDDLQRALSNSHVNDNEFLILKEGEPKDF